MLLQLRCVFLNEFGFTDVNFLVPGYSFSFMFYFIHQNVFLNYVGIERNNI